MEDRKQYIDKLSNQLKEWDDKITEFQQKADSAKEDVKQDYKNRIADIKIKQEQATLELEKIKNSSNAALTDLKIGTQQAFSDLGKAIQSAANHFKK